jgi:hypothetical protein
VEIKLSGIYIYQTSFLRPLSFPPPSGFGLWNRFFSFVRQREKSANSRFFFRAAVGGLTFYALAGE